MYTYTYFCSEESQFVSKEFETLKEAKQVAIRSIDRNPTFKVTKGLGRELVYDHVIRKMDLEEKVLKQFIKTFLPPTAHTPTRGEQVEISYVGDVMRRVMKKHLGSNIPIDNRELLKLFKKMNYPVTTVEGELRGMSTRPWDMMPTSFIGLDSKDVVALRSTCGKLNPNISDDKRSEIECLNDKIGAFRDNIKKQ